MGPGDSQNEKVARGRVMPNVPAWVQFVEEVTRKKAVSKGTPAGDEDRDCDGGDG